MNIHVAIPSHNNAKDLKNLLPALLKQNFSSVTVMDDASIDNTEDLVKSFSKVRYIKSEVNLGTVGANNLILKQIPADGYILFIDSDMEIRSENIPEKLSVFLTQHPRTGAGVGKMVGQNDKRMRWNFGYDINPWRSTLAVITHHPAIWFRRVPFLGSLLRRLSCLFTPQLSSNVAQKVDWGIEGFFFVKTKLWQQLGGFDTRFKRFHEGPDLFLQIRKMGYETWFVPNIVVRDLNQGTGTSTYRAYHWWRSTFIYFYKNPSRLFIYRWPRP